MKIQEIVDNQAVKVKARAKRALTLFKDIELTESQVDVALQIGKRNLMEYSKEEIIRKFVDEEDLIYIGLIEAL